MLQCILVSVALTLICKHFIFIFLTFFVHLCLQGGDSDDDAEGFAGSDDTQPSGDSIPPPSQDLEGISTYGEDDLVPEPHRVSDPRTFVQDELYVGLFRGHISPTLEFYLHELAFFCFCRSTRLRSTTLRRQRKWT